MCFGQKSYILKFLGTSDKNGTWGLAELTLENFASLSLCFIGICTSGRIIFSKTFNNILLILNSIISRTVIQQCNF